MVNGRLVSVSETRFFITQPFRADKPLFSAETIERKQPEAHPLNFLVMEHAN
jgi:hypothetical protein